MPWLYLLFNLVIFISPLVAGRFYRFTVYPKLRPLLISITFPALFFLLYDYLATGRFWMFNSRYIFGIYLTKLPLEEVLFFFTVPFSVLFLWLNFSRLTKKSQLVSPAYFFTILGFTCVFLLYAFTKGLPYTASVLVIFVLSLVVCRFFTPLFTRSAFLWFVLVVIGLTTIFNYILTALPVVIYNPSYLSGAKIITIPLEDYIFGLSLVVFNLSLYTKLSDQSA